METTLIVLAIFMVIAFGYIVYLLKRNTPDKTDDNSQKLMLEYIENLRKEVQDSGGKNRHEIQEKLDKITEQITSHQRASNSSIQKQFEQSAKIISEVTEKLSKIEGTNKQVLGFAEQMQSLENILKNPKQRGVVGEYFLENLLSNILPPANFKMQYKFSSGEIVDAIIIVKDKIIPVDAKFSLENYNRIMQESNKEVREKLESAFKSDLKKRIDETSKYVQQNENTTDFALMFIPADGIFYNLLAQKRGVLDVNTQDFIKYAHSKNVVLVSPMTFYAYLQTILHALKSMQIEESAREIQKQVANLGRHLNAYQEYMGKLGKNITTTVNTYNDSAKEFKKIDKDVMKITEGEEGGKYDVYQLDKPMEE